MKLRCVLSVILLLLCLLGGCAGKNAPTTYTVEYEGISYRVDTQAGTLSDGIHTYQFTFTGDTASYSVDITYPDGSSYWFRMDNGHGGGGWSDNYDENRYTDGDTLCEVLRQQAPAPKRDASLTVVAVLLLVAVGLFNLLAPRKAWYVEYGWRFKDAEPSDTALAFQRAAGIVALAIALFLLFL